MFTPNEECNRVVMQYVRDNLNFRSSGKPYKIKPKDIWDAHKEYTFEEIILTVNYLCDKGLLIKQREDVSPKVVNIAGISDVGFRYLELVDKDSVWNTIKSKFSMDTFFKFANLSLSIASIILNLQN